MAPENQRTKELLAQEGLESIAQKLYNNIYLDLAGDPQSARRWVWELLQNAKDVIVEKGIIEIELDESHVKFAHNGSPFLHSNLLAILSQRSTKTINYTDDEKQQFFDRLFNEQDIDEVEAKRFLTTSGRFGTGFMTTYLLSKQIELESIYTSDGNVRSFKISLDRDVEKPELMKEKVTASFDEFSALENSFSRQDALPNFVVGKNCDTKFIYELNAEGKVVAECGLKDLHNSIAYTLAFVPNLEFIRLIERGIITTYERLEPSICENIHITRIEKNAAGVKSILEVATVAEKHNALIIAVPVKYVSEKKYRILFPTKETPTQFISFPLIGSEAFPFPIIIHSLLFNLDNTRSHVFLNVNTQSEQFDKKVNLNKALFQKAIYLFNQLLNCAAKYEWENTCYLAKSDVPKGIDESWFKESIQQEIRESILNSEIVLTENGKRIKPIDARFPVFRKAKLDEFWKLCKYIYSDKLPRKEDAETWKEIILVDKKDWSGGDLVLDLEVLLKSIEHEQTFKSFKDKFFPSEQSAFEALNDIIKFTEEEEKDLIDRKENPLKILPCQTEDGVFKEKRELSRDVKIPHRLKSILKKMGEDWFGKLVHNEITLFERDSNLTVKDASDKIKEKIDKYLANKLAEDERKKVSDGLFDLLSCTAPNDIEKISELQSKLKRLFPDRMIEPIETINNIENFDWLPSRTWGTKVALWKVAGFSNLDGLAFFLLQKNYPPPKDEYTFEEQEICYKVDLFINDFIEFSHSFQANNLHLLENYAVIPNQLNEFSKFNNQLFNDVQDEQEYEKCERDGNRIPLQLKMIIKDFGADCRKTLLHTGVSLKLMSCRDLKWICKELNDLAIKNQNDPANKQPIRDLDKWIYANPLRLTKDLLEDLFPSFYQKRYGIVLNTYDINERNQFDDIAKSGVGADLAVIAKTTSAQTIREIAKLAKEVNLDNALELLKKHPTMTAEKVEELMELEELSKGWDPELKYNPDVQQKRINLENGWKGEAFVYKDLLKRKLNVEWQNKSVTENGNIILDFEGETHFIADKGHKYDLTVKDVNNKMLYVQVKATTTDITNSDQIALPISVREWNFVFETKENELYYLARVFNLNSNPVVYYLRLEKPESF